MWNMVQIYNDVLSQELYGMNDVSFKVYFDNRLDIKRVCSSLGTDLTGMMSEEDFDDLRQFVKEDIVVTAQEFKILEMQNKIGYC